MRPRELFVKEGTPLLVRQVLKSKIHRATVTDADREYVGSITLDNDLLEAVDLWPGEFVHIWNITNGERFETYVLAAEAGSGIVQINGAGAHKARKGDLVIIAAFAHSDVPVTPRLVLVDDHNKIVRNL
jgi:aspartate 1-decarboxylase